MLVLIVYAVFNNTELPTQSGTAATGSSDGASAGVIEEAFMNKVSDLQVRGTGVVLRVLSDDNEGSRHQRFILELASGQTLLVAHNIDLAPRVKGLQAGDTVEFYGEYEWSQQGGVLHWTHLDPNGQHEHGWLEHNGAKYE